MKGFCDRDADGSDSITGSCLVRWRIDQGKSYENIIVIMICGVMNHRLRWKDARSVRHLLQSIILEFCWKERGKQEKCQDSRYPAEFRTCDLLCYRSAVPARSLALFSSVRTSVGSQDNFSNTFRGFPQSSKGTTNLFHVLKSLLVIFFHGLNAFFHLKNNSQLLVISTNCETRLP